MVEDRDPAVDPGDEVDALARSLLADEMISSAARAGRSIVWIAHGTVGLEAMDRVIRLDAVDHAPQVTPTLVGTSAAG